MREQRTQRIFRILYAVLPALPVLLGLLGVLLAHRHHAAGMLAASPLTDLLLSLLISLPLAVLLLMVLVALKEALLYRGNRQRKLLLTFSLFAMGFSALAVFCYVLATAVTSVGLNTALTFAVPICFFLAFVSLMLYFWQKRREP